MKSKSIDESRVCISVNAKSVTCNAISDLIAANNLQTQLGMPAVLTLDVTRKCYGKFTYVELSIQYTSKLRELKQSLSICVFVFRERFASIRDLIHSLV